MGSKWFEFRPAYTGESNYAATITIEGSGSIAGQTFSGELYDPSGTEVADAVTVAIASAADREITATVEGQDTAGVHMLVIRRTDDGTGAVVCRGQLEISDPGAQ